MFAVEDVFAFGIDEGATDACWQVGWGKDVEEQFAFEGEEEEVVGAAVAFDGAWGVNYRAEEATFACALAKAVTGAFDAGSVDEAGEWVGGLGGCSSGGDGG
eukprot:scaffold118103_cov26-Cyclotella_meneghiniana.AAC.1